MTIDQPASAPGPRLSNGDVTSRRVIARRELLIIFLLIVVAIRGFWLASVIPAPGIDYYQFWLVGQAERRAEIADIYSSQGRDQLLQIGKQLRSEAPDSRRLAAAVDYRKNIETFSTPFLYLAVHSIATGRYNVDFKTFQGLGLACMGLAIALLCRMRRLPWTTAGLVLLTLLTCSDALAVNAQVGNVNTFQVGAIALYLWLLRGPPSISRQVVSGVVLGALIMLKPTLGLVAPFVCIGWAARGEWRRIVHHCAGVVLGSLAAMVASSIFLGSAGAWLEWLSALSYLEQARERSVRLGNFCISRLASELGAPDISLPLLGTSVLATAFVTWVANRVRVTGPATDQPNKTGGAGMQTYDRDYLAVALGCATSVVAFRLVWLHYYLLLAPLAIYLLRPISPLALPVGSPRWERFRMSLIGLAIVAVLGGPMQILPFSGNVYVLATSFSLGAMMLMLIGLVELYRSRVSWDADRVVTEHGA